MRCNRVDDSKSSLLSSGTYSSALKDDSNDDELLGERNAAGKVGERVHELSDEELLLGIRDAIGEAAATKDKFVGKLVKGAGKALGKVAKGAGKAVGGLAKGVGKGVGGLAKGIGKGIGGAIKHQILQKVRTMAALKIWLPLLEIAIPKVFDKDWKGLLEELSKNFKDALIRPLFQMA